MVDIQANRTAAKYSKSELALRFLWSFGQVAFRYSPRPFFGWRRFILRMFGAVVGKQVHIYNSANIYFPWNLTIGDWSAIGEDVLLYNLGRVTIGSKVTISHRAHLCAGTHDYNDPYFVLLKPPISVGDQAWVCANAFVGPGVCIGEGAIVGASAVVVRDVPPWKIMVGNPAKVVRDRHQHPSVV